MLPQQAWRRGGFGFFHLSQLGRTSAQQWCLHPPVGRAFTALRGVAQTDQSQRRRPADQWASYRLLRVTIRAIASRVMGSAELRRPSFTLFVRWFGGCAIAETVRNPP